MVSLKGFCCKDKTLRDCREIRLPSYLYGVTMFLQNFQCIIKCSSFRKLNVFLGCGCHKFIVNINFNFPMLKKIKHKANYNMPLQDEHLFMSYLSFFSPATSFSEYVTLLRCADICRQLRPPCKYRMKLLYFKPAKRFDVAADSE